MGTKPSPMMRGVLNAVVRPTVSCWCEVWDTACSLALGPELKSCWEFRWLLCSSGSSDLRAQHHPLEIFERPWLDTWWSFLLGFIGFMRCLSTLPDHSFHLDIVQDDVADAGDPLPCSEWALGIEMQVAFLGAPAGIASPFISSGIRALDYLDSHGHA